jgi:probable HAF family extracellular repeat protein
LGRNMIMKFVPLITLLVVPVAGLAENYTLVDLGTLGGSQAFAGSIANSKWVVGFSSLQGDTDSREFTYRGKGILEVSPLNGGPIRAGGFSRVNNRGQIASGLMVGSSYYPAIYDLKRNATTVLGSFGGGFYGFTGVALGVNNLGQAVGYSYLPDGTRHAFLWSKRTLIDLGSCGGNSAAVAINDAGTIVGNGSWGAHGESVGFVCRSGVMMPIDPFGGGGSYARDVNSHNEVVGAGLTDNQTVVRGFLWKWGKWIDLGTLPGGHQCDPLAINNRSQVVGVAEAPVGKETYVDPWTGEISEQVIYGEKAFLYEKGRMVELNQLVRRSDWDLIWALDINDGGDIVGYGTLNGKNRAFLLLANAGNRAGGSH